MDRPILVQTRSAGVPMDISKMLHDLYTERRQLDEAIGTLVRLSVDQPKRRGRPPKWMAETRNATPSVTDVPKRRTFSPESRRRMAAAQRKRWAAVKKAEAQP
jgi:hypothetical protein